MFSPIQNQVPKTTENKDPTPFVHALPIAVEVTHSVNPKADVYINDTTIIIVDSEENQMKTERAVLLAIKVVSRKVDSSDPIKRSHMVSMSKLAAKVALEETKIILGLNIDTRNLVVSFPIDKHIAWLKDISAIMKRKQSTHNKVDSLIGRLTHVSVILSKMKHFMSGLRFERKRAKNQRTLKLKEEAIEDLHFHQEFLDYALKGININPLTYRRPSHVYRSVGGYSTKGQVWSQESSIQSNNQTC